MSNKQFFAQIAVFALLGVNVAAYYFFWPAHGGYASRESNVLAQEKSASKDGGDKPVVHIPAPKNFEPLAASSQPPGFPAIVEPMALQPGKDESGIVNPLLKTVQKQPVETPSLALPSPLSAPLEVLPSFNQKAEDKLPFAPAPANELKNGTTNPTVPLPPEISIKPGERVTLPLETSGEKRVVSGERRDNGNDAPNPSSLDPRPSPLASRPLSANDLQKLQQGPWRVHLETVGTRTRLIAQAWYKASARPLAEFNIVCDRVEANAAQNGVQAVGKVIFVGAGLRGSCERLTLPYGEMRMVFEERVELADMSAALPMSAADASLNPGYVLRGERMTWEPPSPVRAAEARTEEAHPANFNPLAPVVIPSEPR